MIDQLSVTVLLLLGLAQLLGNCARFAWQKTPGALVLKLSVLVMNGTAAVFHMAVRCLTPVWLRPVISHMDQWQYLLVLCALVPYSIGAVCWKAGTILVFGCCFLLATWAACLLCTVLVGLVFVSAMCGWSTTKCACAKATKVFQHILMHTAGRFLWAMFQLFGTLFNMPSTLSGGAYMFCVALINCLEAQQPPSVTSPSKQQGSLEPLQPPATGISHVAASATSDSNNSPQPVQLHVSINECVTFSVTVVEDAMAVDAKALQDEKDAYIADLTQEVLELRELHSEMRQLHADASSRCSTATAEASHWQARCGQLQQQLAVAQQAAEECQQQNLAWQQQLWWATREKLQEVNSCWAAKLDAVTRQHQQLQKACEEQQMLLDYYRRGLLADPCYAMQGNGREQLARMVAAEPVLSLHKHFWTLKSSNLLRLWVQHPDLTLAQFEGMYKRMALLVHSDKANAISGQDDEDIKALNNIRALVLNHGQFGGNPS